MFSVGSREYILQFHPSFYTDLSVNVSKYYCFYSFYASGIMYCYCNFNDEKCYILFSKLIEELLLLHLVWKWPNRDLWIINYCIPLECLHNLLSLVAVMHNLFIDPFIFCHLSRPRSWGVGRLSKEAQTSFQLRLEDPSWLTAKNAETALPFYQQSVIPYFHRTPLKTPRGTR